MREFVSANERHPESARVFPWLRPAAGDSVSVERRGAPGSAGGLSQTGRTVLCFSSFNLPQNRSESVPAIRENVIKNDQNYPVWHGRHFSAAQAIGQSAPVDGPDGSKVVPKV